MGAILHAHRRAFGITWFLDALEVTLAGFVAGAVKQSPTLHLDNTQVELASSAYLGARAPVVSDHGLADQRVSGLVLPARL